MILPPRFPGIAATALVAIALAPGGARAAMSSGAVTVTATVASKACTISGGTFNFGTIIAGQHVTASDSGLSVTCNSGTPYVISLSTGKSGTFSGRTMTPVAASGPPTALAYQLFTDNAFTKVFGDGTAGTSTIAQTGNGAVQFFSIFGALLNPKTSQPPGTYADTVIATVTF